MEKAAVMAKKMNLAAEMRKIYPRLLLEILYATSWNESIYLTLATLLRILRVIQLKMAEAIMRRMKT